MTGGKVFQKDIKKAKTEFLGEMAETIGFSEVTYTHSNYADSPLENVLAGEH